MPLPNSPAISVIAWVSIPPPRKESSFAEPVVHLIRKFDLINANCYVLESGFTNISQVVSLSLLQHTRMSLICSLPALGFPLIVVISSFLQFYVGKINYLRELSQNIKNSSLHCQIMTNWHDIVKLKYLVLGSLIPACNILITDI